MLSEEALNIIADTGGWAGSPKDITEMARELLASRWTRITENNPLRMGDETFYWEGGRFHVTTVDHDYAPGDPCPYTHRRPVNPPPATQHA